MWTFVNKQTDSWNENVYVRNKKLPWVLVWFWSQNSQISSDSVSQATESSFWTPPDARVWFCFQISVVFLSLSSITGVYSLFFRLKTIYIRAGMKKIMIIIMLQMVCLDIIAGDIGATRRNQFVFIKSWLVIFKLKTSFSICSQFFQISCYLKPHFYIIYLICPCTLALM